MLINSQKNTDIFYMQMALEQANKAFKKNEVPIGAIIKDENNRILSKAYNLVENRKCQSAHAEIIAIEKACKKINDWRLNNCAIYVTLEPCAMCMNLILLSRIKFLFFSLRSNIYGYNIDKYNTFEIYKSPLIINEGICEQESLYMLKNFFKNKRIEKK